MSQLPAINQEAERLPPKLTLSVTAWVVLFGCGLGGTAYWLLSARARTLPRAATVPAAPRVAAAVHGVPSGLLREPAAGELQKQHQRNALRHYAWVDQARGIVKIPIDVAISLEAAESEPTR